jgi:voltage-gated potassium channel
MYTVIFGTETRAGKGFDLILLVLILLSVFAVVLESVRPIREEFSGIFTTSEWIFTIAFTMEYLLRIYSHPKPLRYIFSFLGIIDLLAILPTYLGLFFDQATFLLTVRAFRLLRVFRILKLTRYITEANLLLKAMRESVYKITIFFGVVLSLVLLLGTVMYMVEGERSGFTSIPQSIYWAIVTITTVGYGDVAPVTVLGKLIASIAMLTGYSIIAVPTGIITVEIGKAARKQRQDKTTKVCNRCGHESKELDAGYCSRCGEKLKNKQGPENQG